MARAPGVVAMRRLQNELREWVQRPPEGCALLTHEPLLVWTFEMAGAGAFYEGRSFRLRVAFSDRYPLEPPEVVFLAPAPVHPHVYSNGHICLDVLYDSPNGGWSPALTVAKVALSLRSMLASAPAAAPPPGDAEYCARTRGRSPKETRWEFEDERV